MDQKIFSLKTRDGIEWLECQPLAREPGIVHAFSTRHNSGRDSRSSHIPPAGGATTLAGQRHGLLAALAAEDFRSAHLRQIHSSKVVRVSNSENGGNLEFQFPDEDGEHLSRSGLEGDALLTNEPGIMLEVRAADCVPILIADPRRRAIAAAHAGWRGALARIVEKAVGEMRRQFGSCAEDLVAAIGPSIRACCYEVGKEVLQAFADEFPDSDKFFRTPSRKSAATETHLDLIAVARRQLRLAGVDDSKIFVADYCTACRTDLFYSYRKEGNRAGRMMALIGMRPAKNG